MKHKYKGYAIDKLWIPLVDTFWSFYPITYKDKQYVIDIEGVGDRLIGFLITPQPVCRIYEYQKKWRLFRKHKRKMILSFDIPNIEISNSMIFNTSNVELCDFIMYMPEVMEFIFKEFEKQKIDIERKKLKENEKKKLIKKNKQWNGIVK